MNSIIEGQQEYIRYADYVKLAHPITVKLIAEEDWKTLSKHEVITLLHDLKRANDTHTLKDLYFVNLFPK